MKEGEGVSYLGLSMRFYFLLIISFDEEGRGPNWLELCRTFNCNLFFFEKGIPVGSIFASLAGSLVVTCIVLEIHSVLDYTSPSPRLPSLRLRSRQFCFELSGYVSFSRFF